MARKEISETIEMEHDPVTESVPDALPEAVPAVKKFVKVNGRGGLGKTVFLRLIAERALLRGAPLLIADADRTNATLTAFFGEKNVNRPPSANAHTFKEWHNSLIEAQIEGNYSIVEDVGGGDPIMQEYAKELGLVEFCVANGVEPVAIHCIGGDKDHLAVLRDIEESNAFCPEKTLIVLNEAILPAGKDASNGFDTVLNHEIFLKAASRGAKWMFMPALSCMDKIDAARLLFNEAASRTEKNGVKLGLVDAHKTRRWMDLMEERLAPFAGWLP